MRIAHSLSTQLCLKACLLALILTASSARLASQRTTPSLRSNPATIDALLDDFYRSLSFGEGQQPDWIRFRDLFASPQSPCVRIAGDSVMQMDRESFIAFFSGRIQRGALKSFAEEEIGRTGEYYGSLATIFSAYEKRMNLAEDGKPTRGINSFQLYRKDGRWWIASVTWQDESSSLPIPPRYLSQ